MEILRPAGQIIADALERLYGNGGDMGAVLLKTVKPHKPGITAYKAACKTVYRGLLERFREGSYSPEDLEVADGLLGNGMHYKQFDLDATERESKYLKKLLEESNK